VAALLGAVACGGTTRTGVATRGNGARAGTDGAGGESATSAGGAGGTTLFGAAGQDFLGDPGGTMSMNSCAVATYSIEPLPTDRYVMFEQSSSMGESIPGGSGTWWTAAQNAWTHFLASSTSTGHFVGIQYFPLAEPDSATSCNAPYSTPDVELGQLPDSAAALVASFDNHGPSVAARATGPALEGAIDHMKAWASLHPGRAPVVVLVMAGFPTECTAQGTPDLATLAKFAFDTEPKIRTRVIGLNLGSKGRTLDAVAKAGGTVAATLIEAADVGAPLEEALRRVPGSPGGCSLDPPNPMDPVDPDRTRIELRYTPDATGIMRGVSQVGDAGECSSTVRGEGWYFDSPTTPTKIEVCPELCSALDLGVVQLTRGCRPRGPIPK
jgi:hypothetical protein